MCEKCRVDGIARMAASDSILAEEKKVLSSTNDIRYVLDARLSVNDISMWSIN